MRDGKTEGYRAVLPRVFGARLGRGGGAMRPSDAFFATGWPWGLVVALGAFLLYLDTLAPTVVPYSYPDARDPGVLQIKAALLAVPDVTGYPTWVVLTHLFTYLPFGDEAYRANLASAAYAAVAVLFVYLVGLRLTRRAVPSAVGATLFATSQTFWSQAVMAEVYTLHALFVATVVYVLLVWRDGGRDRHLLLAAFLMGLSLTHHLTSGLLIPAGFLLVGLVAPRTLLRWRLGLKCAALFLLGLTPYLFLPIRASMDPPFSGADPTSFRGFYELVSGAGFKSAMFAFGPGELPGRVGLYLGHLVQQFHPMFLAVAMLGAVALLLAGDRATLVFMGFLYAGWLFYALEYDIGDIEPYFIPTHLLVCLWAAVGAGALLRWAEGAAASPRGLSGTARGAVAVVLPVAALALPFLGVDERHGAVDRSGEHEGRRVIEVVEKEVKRGAVVMQHRSPLLYMQQVEGRRMDLTVSSSPFRRLSGEMQGLGALEGYLREGKSVYALDPHPEAVRLWERDGYNLAPVGGEVGLYEISE